MIYFLLGVCLVISVTTTAYYKADRDHFKREYFAVLNENIRKHQNLTKLLKEACDGVEFAMGRPIKAQGQYPVFKANHFKN